jgi:hypothetical protein
MGTMKQHHVSETFQVWKYVLSKKKRGSSNKLNGFFTSLTNDDMLLEGLDNENFARKLSLDKIIPGVN